MSSNQYSPKRVTAPSLLVVLLSALGAGCGDGADENFASPQPSFIQQVDVERVLSTLAADDFRGRRAFTDDALRAADYLAGQFADAGLQDPSGNSHIQAFDVRALSAENSSVVLNGQALPQDQFVVRQGSSDVAWSTGDVEVVRVDPSVDMRGVMSSIRAVDAGGLILLGAEQEELFQALSGFMRRPTRSLGDGDTPTVVLAMWDGQGEPTYEVSSSTRKTLEPLANVVGVLPGRRTDEYVLFSGHYDHIGIRPAVNGDSIGNGANDDASGTTAVVELARYFASRGTPERTLLFAAFTAEEAGGYGSRYYSSQLDPDEIVAMFNIEMIGKPAVEGPNTAWITGFERSSFGTLLQEAVEGTEFSFYPDPYPEQDLFYRSDNATLARLGVPAHSISTTPIDVDPDYHQVSDEVATLDLEHMTATIRAIAMGAERIIAGEATPTRVDPATVRGR